MIKEWFRIHFLMTQQPCGLLSYTM